MSATGLADCWAARANGAELKLKAARSPAMQKVAKRFIRLFLDVWSSNR